MIENLTFSGIGRHLGMNGEEINRFAVVGFKLLQEYSARRFYLPASGKC